VQGGLGEHGLTELFKALSTLAVAVVLASVLVGALVHMCRGTACVRDCGLGGATRHGKEEVCLVPHCRRHPRITPHPASMKLGRAVEYPLAPRPQGLLVPTIEESPLFVGMGDAASHGLGEVLIEGLNLLKAVLRGL
jgi:hypothetical protein